MRPLNVICLVWLALLFASLDVCGQVSIGDFLRSAQHDATVKILDEQISYLQGKPYRLSYLNKLEVRAQNNEIYGDNHRYGVRLTPTNPWEVISNNRYYKTYKETLVLEKEVALKEALLVRYNHVVELLYLQELRALLEKERTLEETQLKALERQQYSDFFDVDDFIDLKLDLVSKGVEVEDAVYEISKQVSRIDAVYDSVYVKSLDWRMEDVISIDDIAKVVDSVVSSDIQSAVLAYREKRITLAQREYALERSNIGLGFIQTQYTKGRPSTESPWGISAGITIPITNPNKGDMAKRQLDVIEAKNEKLQVESGLKAEKAKEYDQMKVLIERYHALEKRIEGLNAGSLSSTLSAMSANNPIVTMKLNANLLKLEGILLKLKRDIFENYIEFLAVQDRLQQRPLVDYLSVGLKHIDEN